jgi:hypothetical protein
MKPVWTFILIFLLLGCSQKPPPHTHGPLTKTEIHWYEQKAASWFHDTWSPSGQGQGKDRKDYLRTVPVKTELSDDETTVTVFLPEKVTKFVEKWVSVSIDTRTGQIKNTGSQIVRKDYFDKSGPNR